MPRNMLSERHCYGKNTHRYWLCRVEFRVVLRAQRQ